MLQTGKKLLCVALALLMLLSGVAAAALAAEDDSDGPDPVAIIMETADTEERETDDPVNGTEEETDSGIMAVDEGTIGLSGSGTEDDPFQVGTAEELQMLDAAVEAGETFAGSYVKMTADISLPADFDGLGYGAGLAGKIASANDECRGFSGDFNGSGYTLTVAEGAVSPFDYVSGAVIHDLSVFGQRIEGCGVVNTYVSGGGDVTFRNVILKTGTQTLRSGFIGGYGNGVVTIENCTVESDVVIGYTKDETWIGSFGGEFNGSITNCTSGATVYGVNFVGGIVGDKGQSMQPFTVDSCTFTGEVIATGEYVGGIVGAGYAGTRWGMPSAWACRGVTVRNCVMSGSVSGGKGVGGILGGEGAQAQAWENGPTIIQNNQVTGQVTGTTYVGAVIGYMISLNRNSSISGNSYESDCGSDVGIGAVGAVDTSGHEEGMDGGTYYFSSSTANGKTAAEIRSEVPGHALEQYITVSTLCSAGYKNQFKVDHNRTDDPLGKDAEDLCYPIAPPDEPTDPDEPEEPSEPVAVKLSVSGDYKKTYTVGDSLNTDGMTFTVTWSDGSTTNPTAAEITFSGFDSSKAGSCTVTAKYGTVSTSFSVTVEPASSKIRVTVAVYGDYRHDSDSDGKKHGLAMGGLTTWIAASSWEADTKETVWDVLQRVFSAKGIKARTSGSGSSVYLSGLSYNGVSLSDFDNGTNSGWMYTVNGAHPEVGIGQRYVRDGDRIILHYSDDYTKEQGSEGYDDETVDSAVENVIALIRAIGAPVTEASRAAVEQARKAYDALTYSQKNKVDNYRTLTAAEQALKDLKTAADAKAAGQVTKVIADISATVTEKDRQRVEAARKAYDALTDDQKALVTNYALLTAAEKTLAEAEASAEDKKAAEKVKKLIADLGEIGTDSVDAVHAARQAYDSLTELQKKLVDNYDVLLKAEQMLASLQAAEKYRSVYETTGDYLQSLGTPVTGAIGGEWMLIGLVRSGRPLDGLEQYLDSAEQYVKENADEQGRLHRAKSSDNARMILALTALGMDVTDFAGCDLLAGLTDMEYVKKQGINGPSWALIALDSGAYRIPDNTTAADPVTREKLIACLLDAQLEDGGWALSGTTSDSDMTGMVLQAMAPYYGKDPAVTEAVERALDTVSRMQTSDGGFSAFSGDGSMVATSESLSQILTALSALGIDAGRDERFIKNGKSILDALCVFYVEGGGFRHTPDGELDGMATEQAYYALTAYFRMLEGKTSLYDMTDVLPERAPQAEEALAEEADRPAEDMSEEEHYENVASAAAAAAGPEDGKHAPAFLLWGIPAVAAVGAAAYVIDRKRRAAKK